MSFQCYVGTSGWHYEHWRDRFYPEGLSKDGWLKFYASHFNTVELNNSFYRLPSEAAFAGWYNSSPANFTFAVKGNTNRAMKNIHRAIEANAEVATRRKNMENNIDKPSQKAP
ncbi:unnamed protein product [marine sediment metagenome]|uniref:Protein containing DUF72 n=1 Tax=marine sediment metagenome TaxID=412755 RepID=X1SV62_9ZZZZ